MKVVALGEEFSEMQAKSHRPFIFGWFFSSQEVSLSLRGIRLKTDVELVQALIPISEGLP